MGFRTETLVTLTHGGFQCVPDHAVEVAHMMSCAEAAFEAGTLPDFEVLEVLRDYLRGAITADEAIKDYHENWPEAFPGLSMLDTGAPA